MFQIRSDRYPRNRLEQNAEDYHEEQRRNRVEGAFSLTFYLWIVHVGGLLINKTIASLYKMAIMINRSLFSCGIPWILD